MNKDIKVGDTIICIPGYQKKFSSRDDYGGAGYFEGREAIVSEISQGDRKRGRVIWSKDFGGGVYEYALRKKERVDTYEIY